jgi:hypothetical protein
MFLLVSDGDVKKSSQFSFSTFDKIITAFNLKKDRYLCFSCRYFIFKAADMTSGKTWTEFITRIKERVVQSINTQLIQYYDDLRRNEQQRLVPGWNYLQNFTLKVPFK